MLDSVGKGKKKKKKELKYFDRHEMLGYQNSIQQDS